MPQGFIILACVAAFFGGWSLMLVWRKQIIGAYLMLLIATVVLIIAAIRYAGKG